MSYNSLSTIPVSRCVCANPRYDDRHFLVDAAFDVEAESTLLIRNDVDVNQIDAQIARRRARVGIILKEWIVLLTKNLLVEL